MKFVQIQLLSSYKEIIHFQSRRDCGVSAAPYHSLNLSYWTGDHSHHVLENRYLVACEMGIPLENFVIARQTHSANVRVVTKAERGCGVWFENKEALLDVDALVTDVPETVLCVSTADCIPVLLYDPVKRVVAAAHAGWKGTAQRIVVQTTDRMVYHYGCDRKDIIAGIGVGAGICCYEVDEKVALALQRTLRDQCPDKYLIEKPEGKYHADLKMVNRLQLMEAGLLPHHIEVHPHCSICSSGEYFSYRNSDRVRFGQSLAGIAIAGI